MNTVLKIKRGSKDTLNAFMNNPVLRLKEGEQQYTTDTHELYISDGTNCYIIGNLKSGPYEDIPDAGVKDRLYFVNDGTHAGTLLWDDGTNWISIVTGQTTAHTHLKSHISDLEAISTTPTANAIPKAGSDGKLDREWLPSVSPLLFPRVKKQQTTLYQALNYHFNVSNPITPSTSRIYYIPFMVPRVMTITHLGITVTVIASNKYASVGIYDTTTLENGSENPNNLIASVSGISVGVTGIRDGQLSTNITLEPGVLYWCAYICNGSPEVHGVSPDSQFNALGQKGGASPISYYYESGSDYSLPLKAGQSLSAAESKPYPTIYVKEVLS